MDRAAVAKQRRLFGLMVGAEVEKRGGEVVILVSAMIPLLKRGHSSKLMGSALEFTLTEPDGKDRGISTYSNRAFYRLDMVMKYLIETSPEKKLSFTNDDLERGNVPLNIDVCNEGLLAQTNVSKREIRDGDSVHILGQSEIVKFDEQIDSPRSKAN